VFSRTSYPQLCNVYKKEKFVIRLFELEIGMSQGSCRAPAFFALCINNIIKSCNAAKSGLSIVYVDDALLVTRSVYLLQRKFDSVHAVFLSYRVKTKFLVISLYSYKPAL
jgi:hypothetical protein